MRSWLSLHLPMLSMLALFLAIAVLVIVVPGIRARRHRDAMRARLGDMPRGGGGSVADDGRRDGDGPRAA